MRTQGQRQNGVAAIEFAIVVLVLLLALYGIATFGAVLYTQQAMARAASDGARAMQARPSLGAVDVQNVVWDSLAQSLITPQHHANFDERRSWIASHVVVDISLLASGSLVTVTYPYRVNRLLPSLPLLDASRWMPDHLRSRAATSL